MQLDVGTNLEGISRSKREYLNRLMRDNDVNLIAIQETHTN
jgi:hypothetical protein